MLDLPEFLDTFRYELLTHVQYIRSTRESNVFTGVCHSVHGEVGEYAWSQVPSVESGFAWYQVPSMGGYAWTPLPL